MAERIPAPTDIAKTNWNSDGTTYPSVDPGGAKRATGFKPKDVPTPGDGEIITANDQNYLHGLAMQMHNWMKQFIPREWEWLHEGIDAASDLDIFRVMPAATIQPRGTEVFKVTGTGLGSTTVSPPCTDGEQIYYLGGALRLVAASPEDGAEIFDEDDLGVGMSCVCADGGFVYVMTVDNGYLGLYRMSRTTGLELASTGGAAEYGCDAIAANGAYCVGIDPTTNAGFVVFYSSIQGTIAEDGTYDTTTTDLRAVAIDAEQCYVGGVQAGGFDIWALTLSTRALAWTWTALTTSNPQIEGIATDGDRVYVTTNLVTFTAGGQANLFCLDRFKGELLWSMNVRPSPAGTVNLEGITVDHRYLYVVDANDDLHVISKLGVPAQLLMVADFGRPVCDGVSVIGNSQLTTELRRLWMADGVTTFQKVPITDVARRPFYTLALPGGDRT